MNARIPRAAGGGGRVYSGGTAAARFGFDMVQRVLIFVAVLAIVVAIALVPFAPKPVPVARTTVAPPPQQRVHRPTSRPARFRHPTTHPYVFTSFGRPTTRRGRPLPSDFALPTNADEPPAPEPVYPEPLAREALPYVGLDQDADEVWYTAINDPALPPDARRELIEDLNQEGLPEDPRNLMPADLPLIEARLAIIEEVAPDAADETNAEAFAEAYRDLMAMYERIAPPPPMEEDEAGFEPAPGSAPPQSQQPPQ